MNDEANIEKAQNKLKSHNCQTWVCVSLASEDADQGEQQRGDGEVEGGHHQSPRGGKRPPGPELYLSFVALTLVLDLDVTWERDTWLVIFIHATQISTPNVSLPSSY